MVALKALLPKNEQETHWVEACLLRLGTNV